MAFDVCLTTRTSISTWPTGCMPRPGPRSRAASAGPPRRNRVHLIHLAAAGPECQAAWESDDPMTASHSAPAAAGGQLDFKKILPVFTIVLIDLLGLTIIIPLLPLYATSFGASAFTIGVLGAAYPVMQFVGAPLLGRLSDRYGRKPVLLISQLGTLVGFLTLGFANALWLLFLARLLDGLSGANISTAQAVITDSTTEKTRTQALGLLGAAFGLGFIVGPIIAFISLALSGNNYHVPAFVAAAFSALSMLLTWFWLTETHPAGSRGAAVAEGAISLQSMPRA